ncbi:hypothetical protein BGX26_010592 [Mortierella sp. AD094]|nr:hypothetical protein BGX26_010592 [Mortierella sp. AD094]
MTATQTAKFVQQHKYDPRYEIVWRMVAGQLKGEALELFFDLLQGAPRDLIGGRHQQLLAECLKETRPRLNGIALKRLEAEMTEWLKFDMEMYHGDFKAHFNDNGSERSLGSYSAFPQEILVSVMDLNEKARKYVLVALRGHRNLTSSTIEALSSCLRGGDKENRELAADALCGKSTLPESAIETLFGAVLDKSFVYINSPAMLLGNQDYLPESTIATLTSTLLSNNSRARSFAAHVMAIISCRAQITLPEPAILALIRTLHDKSIVGAHAALALSRLTTLTENIIESLNSSIQGGCQETRCKALQAFYDVVAHSQVTLPESTIMVIVSTIRDDRGRVRSAAVETIGVLPELPESAILALISTLHCENLDAKISAAQAFGTQSVLPENAIQALISALQDKNGDVKRASTRVLCNQPATREYSIKVQIAALKDSDSHARSLAARVLGMIASNALSKFPESAITSLVNALQDYCDISEGSNVRVSVAKALGVQLKLPGFAVSALVDTLQDEVLDVKKSAAGTLATQPKLPGSAAPALTNALENGDNDLGDSALKALGVVSVLPESAISALVSILKNDNDDPGTKILATTALGTQSQFPESTILDLTHAVQSNDLEVKSYIAEALGTQSILPEDAILALIRVLAKNMSYMQIVTAIGNQPFLTKPVIKILTRNRSSTPKKSKDAPPQSNGRAPNATTQSTAPTNPRLSTNQRHPDFHPPYPRPNRPVTLSQHQAPVMLDNRLAHSMSQIRASSGYNLEAERQARVEDELERMRIEAYGAAAVRSPPM